MNKDEFLQNLLNDNSHDYSVLGDAAFTAFYNSKHGLSYNSQPLHVYKTMDPKFQTAWNAFAYAVATEGSSTEEAWDEYYLEITGANYDNNKKTPHYQELDPKTRYAIISAKEAVYKFTIAENQTQSKH